MEELSKKEKQRKLKKSEPQPKSYTLKNKLRVYHKLCSFHVKLKFFCAHEENRKFSKEREEYKEQNGIF